MSLLRRYLALVNVRWLTAALILVVVGLVAGLLVTQWDVVVTFPWRLHVGYLALVVLLHSIALGVTFVIWHLMVARLGGFAQWGANFRYYYVSTLAKRVPTSLPFVGSRLVMYRKVGVPSPVVINCIVLETVLVGIGGVIALVALSPFYPRVPVALVVAFSVPAAILIGLLLLRPSVFFDLTNRLLRRFNRPTLDRVPARRDVMLWTALYVLPWLFSGASFFYAPQAFSTVAGPGLLEATTISTTSMLVSLGSLFLPSGFGLREITFTFLLSPWMPLPVAIVLALAFRITHTIDEIVWALMALLLTNNQP